MTENTVRKMFTVVMTVVLVAAAACSAGAQTMERKTVMVRMRDGVKLATDIYLPKTDRKVPVILLRTPYGREGMSMILAYMQGKNVALAVQDMRGRHGSEGVSAAFISEPLDGYETVEWLARQPWCNGRVGTAGISALGITQYLMHKRPPEHLVCQNVMAAPESLYQTIVYQGGAVRRALFYGWVLGQGFPLEVMSLILSEVDYNDMWRLMDLSTAYDKVDVPIMHMAGWYDLYLRGNLHAFTHIQEEGGPGARGKQRLVIGPWIHSGFLGLTGTKVGELEYPANMKYPLQDVIAWFQECLQGKDRGFMDGPPVRYYVMGDTGDPDAPGNEWRAAGGWPVPADPVAYYFHPDGELGTDAPAGENVPIEFVDDPWNPVPTLGSRAHGEQRHPVDLRPIEEREDVLVFSTPPLDEPLEVTGPITAKIFFETDVVDTDFVVRLSDVYPDGRSMLLTDGILRASHRESFEYRTLLEPGEQYSIEVEVWPTSIIFNTGHRIRVSVSGTNFPRFDINHHNGQYHDISPGELEKARETGVEEYVYTPDPSPDALVAHTKLYLDSERPSHIVLPVVGDRL